MDGVFEAVCDNDGVLEGDPENDVETDIVTDGDGLTVIDSVAVGVVDEVGEEVSVAVVSSEEVGEPV